MDQQILLVDFDSLNMDVKVNQLLRQKIIALAQSQNWDIFAVGVKTAECLEVPAIFTNSAQAIEQLRNKTNLKIRLLSTNISVYVPLQSKIVSQFNAMQFLIIPKESLQTIESTLEQMQQILTMA